MRRAANVTTRIRRARLDDLAELLDLLDELQEGATPGIPWGRGDAVWTATVWEEILTDPRRVYLIAEEDDRVVGTADLLILPNLTHGARPIAFVENVVVTTDRRGDGIGRALMDDIMSRAEAEGCYKVQLLSANGRSGAHAFYEDLGFEASSRGYRRYLIRDAVR
jgi:ribosomal protein S18 acetylase RimI-like enzyme